MGRKPNQTSSGRRGKATPVVVRPLAARVTERLTKKTSPKALAFDQKPKAAALKISGKPKTRNSSKSSAPRERRKSAYSLYSAECRADVLRGQGIEDVPQNFGEASRAVARSWSELDAEAKQKFEVRGRIDQHRGTLLGFAKKRSLEKDVEKVASEVRHAIKDFGKLPREERAGELVAGVIAAMQELDKKLSRDLQAALGASVGDRLPSAEAAQNFRKALGTELGGRLVTLLQRWHKAAASKPRAATATPTPARSARPQAASSASMAPAKRPQAASSSSTAPAEEAGDAGAVDNTTRNKVVGIMMKTSARGSGKASFQTCRNIEEELFKLYGLTPKEYFRRARSLRFNLGAADGALLKRVQEGELSPAELVKMNIEDLAPEAVREERERERERYFKTEVHLTGRIRKRRRTNYGRAAERLSDGSGFLDETQARQGSFGGESQADVAASQADAAAQEAATAAEPQAEQPALHPRIAARRAARSDALVAISDKESSSDSDSGSDSSSSSGSSSSVVDIEAELASLLEQDPVPLQALGSRGSDPAVSAATDLEIAKVLQEAASASASSSSSDSSSEESEADPQMHMAMAEGRAQLWAMGFSTEDADAALLRTKGNLDRAVAILLKKPA